jgi:hypothetical protein
MWQREKWFASWWTGETGVGVGWRKGERERVQRKDLPFKGTLPVTYFLQLGHHLLKAHSPFSYELINGLIHW